MSPVTTYRRVILPQAGASDRAADRQPDHLDAQAHLAGPGDRASRTSLTTAQLIYGRNFQQIPLLIVASIWYLVLTTVLTIVQSRLEKRMSRRIGRTSTSADGGRAMTDRAMVEAIGVRKVYGDNEVLKSIDLTVDRGEVVSLLGPSGSGKSTFLRCINHLERVDGGEISVNGHLVGYRRAHGKKYELHRKEIAAARRDVGMVFQRFNLFPHRTALENVMEAPVYVKRRNKDEVRKQARGTARPGRARRPLRTSTRRRSPAVSSNGSPSPGRWPWSRR